MCFDTNDPTLSEFTEAEETYINTVGDFLTAERDSRLAAEAQQAATAPVREQFDNRVDAVTREVELINEAVKRSVGEDTPEGERAIGAATLMLRVEEAVASGADRLAALTRAVALGEDPRTPVGNDPFEDVSLDGLL